MSEDKNEVSIFNSFHFYKEAKSVFSNILLNIGNELDTLPNPRLKIHKNQ